MRSLAILLLVLGTSSTARAVNLRIPLSAVEAVVFSVGQPFYRTSQIETNVSRHQDGNQALTGKRHMQTPIVAEHRVSLLGRHGFARVPLAVSMDARQRRARPPTNVTGNV